MKRQELAPEIAEMAEAPLSLEEFERRLAVPPTEEEVAELMSLVRWFTGRYPTAKERFAYVRRKYAEWTRVPPARIAGPAAPAGALDHISQRCEGLRADHDLER